MSERASLVLSRGALAAIVLVYLHNTVPYLTMLPRINVDEPWLIERAYQLALTGAPSQPMFLLDRGYLLQPGYSLLLAPWLELFGVGLLQSRVLAVLCGLGAVLAVGALGRMWFGAAAGAIAAMLLATDSNFLGVARMARTDAPSVMFVALGLALSLHGLRTSRLRYAFAGGIATGLAILCHANSYWVGVIVFFWYLVAFGWRLVQTPTAYAYAAGLAVSVGPYLAIVLFNIDEFNSQLHLFAIERVPGFSPAILWHQITQESIRYRDWYFGLITNQYPNYLLVAFQFCAAAGAVFLLWRVWVGRGSSASARPETQAALLVFGSAAIFAALIPNKALVYLPHLLVGFAVAAGAVVARTLELIPLAPTPRAGRVPPASAVFVLAWGAAAVVLYQGWYAVMRTTELRPYEETHAIVDAMVPPGPKYLIASPTFWLPFYDEPETRFLAYTAAGPYETVVPRGFYTGRRLRDLPQDRPFFLLLDDAEWRAVLEDPTFDSEWQRIWTSYIARACVTVRVVFGTAHGTLALYRCGDDVDRRAAPIRYAFEGHEYEPGERVWSADPDALAGWTRYRPETALRVEGDQLRVSAPAGGGIYADVPVEPGAVYLLRADIEDAQPSDQMSLHDMAPDGSPVRSQWLKLGSNDWFPSGAVVRPATDSLRVYLYSEAATNFGVRSVELIQLSDVRATRSRE